MCDEDVEKFFEMFFVEGLVVQGEIVFDYCVCVLIDEKGYVFIVDWFDFVDGKDMVQFGYQVGCGINKGFIEIENDGGYGRYEGRVLIFVEF